MLRSLNQLARVRMAILGARRAWLRVRHGLVMHPTATVSLSGRIVSGGRGAIAIGEHTLVAFKTLLIARETGGGVRPIRIGARCFIGGGATVLPGVTLGDEVIVAAGAVVFDDVPAHSIVAGNPARVVRAGVRVGPRGRLEGAYEKELERWGG